MYFVGRSGLMRRNPSSTTRLVGLAVAAQKHSSKWWTLYLLAVGLEYEKLESFTCAIGRPFRVIVWACCAHSLSTFTD